MSEMALVDAVKSANYSLVKELIESGTQIDQLDKQGWTSMNWAAASGDLEMVEVLLQHGADPFTVGRDLRTPQMIALAAGRVEVVKRLRRAEAEIKGGDVEQSDRKYCMGFRLEDLRRYAAWTENKINGRETSTGSVGEESVGAPGLGANDIVFLHQDYRVTASIWPDEDIIFDEVTDGWKSFCTNELRFSVPDSLDLITQAEQVSQSAA